MLGTIRLAAICPEGSAGGPRRGVGTTPGAAPPPTGLLDLQGWSRLSAEGSSYLLNPDSGVL